MQFRLNTHWMDAAGISREINKLLRELLALELDYCRRAGDQPSSKEYRRRFPDPEDGKLIDGVFHEYPTEDSSKPPVVRQVPDLPPTISGKTVELAVRKVLHGEPVENTDALANPESLEVFRRLASELAP